MLASDKPVRMTGAMTLDMLLAKWLDKEGGAERANYQMFLTEFAQALELPAPDPKGTGLGDYQFEAPVNSPAMLGKSGKGRIDLYKRDCFILEAKQSQIKPGRPLPLDLPEPPQPIHDLFGAITGYIEPSGKPIGRYDTLMADARIQAEKYALALPGDHPSPPFLIVADIGRSFELYFDWSGNGRGYGPFPDEQHYRVGLAQLRDEKVRALFRGIWTDPKSVDPRLKAVEVTRDIAVRLSRVAEQLETDQRQAHPGDAQVALGIEATSLFLMRLLFCMFAEDVELLPRDSFKQFLGEATGKSALFWRNGLTDLWSKMNRRDEVDRFWLAGDAIVRYFNGNLFSGAQIFDLPPEFKQELYVAAGKNWRAVEPAIFGTLLEQVLTAKDRAKLGAHYTPRVYVERLVQATIMDVLRPEWDAVLAQARDRADAGDAAGAIAAACAFHARLIDQRVLDPACGTGNFLYVAMDALMRLETEVRQFVVGLGGTLAPGVHPNQFLGLELNPRAAVIAELVLWIGWLRYRLANTPEAIGEPVLPPLVNINRGTHGGYDAVLVRTATGAPDRTIPHRPVWPEADFIIGNPPFIGGKDVRERLGSDYAEALWAATPHVPKSADFVMHWWDRAADILTQPDTRLRRFGFVTTNSITQIFSRRVIERYLARQGTSPGEVAQKNMLHLTLAIGDHPWTRVGKDAAAVRIAMTVAEAGPGVGRLVTITSESALDTDAPVLTETERVGVVNADLTAGTDVTRLLKLRANKGIGHKGYQLNGEGFVITGLMRQELGGDENIIKRYYIGSDINTRDRGLFVIDVFPMSEKTLRTKLPAIYQHLIKTVYPERIKNAVSYRRENWWLFGQPSTEIRTATMGLSRIIATPRQGKYRLFMFVDGASILESTNVVIASSDAWILGTLQSRVHEEFSLAAGGWMGVGNDPRYFHTMTFDPFPFPDPTPDQRASIAEIAEELDATRRTALAENPALTMTGLYNLVADLRSGVALTPAREGEMVRARARIVAKLHDDLDAAVADAYGWGDDWRNGLLTAAEIVTRLVALNARRAAEEAIGKVRWLRPDYQVPRFARPVAPTTA